jgi:hypothetical protein
MQTSKLRASFFINRQIATIRSFFVVYADRNGLKRVFMAFFCYLRGVKIPARRLETYIARETDRQYGHFAYPLS